MAITIQDQLRKKTGLPSPEENKTRDTATENKKTEKKKSQFGFFTRFISIPAKEKIFFVQQLGIMTQTGVSLSAGLKTLSEQTKNKKFKKILLSLKETVERGNQLSDGLMVYEKVFGELFINMIRSGESSGKLEEVLKQLFVQMKKDHAIVTKVRGAMIYPSIILTAMLGVGIMVVVYIIPNLITVFEDLGANLPFATRALINISKFSTQYGIFLLIGGIVLVSMFFWAITRKTGKHAFHTLLLSLPIIGGIIKKINIARFCRTFSSLLKTDISIVRTFEITSKVLGNVRYQSALVEAKEKIKKGQTVHDSLSPYPKLFPPIILQMVSVGEETGSMDDILEQSAVFFEDDVDQIMKNLPSIIEPILILLLGVGVGAMAIAIIMPMYSLSQQI